MVRPRGGFTTGRLSSNHAVIQLRRRITAEQIDNDGSQAATEATTVAMYQVVAGRRQAIDTMMWQVPSLSLTAQAFLLTISLGSDSSRLARLVAAFLGSIAMGMCLQLMAKYRHLEVVDSRIAESLEQRLSGSFAQAQIHSSPNRRAKALGMVPNWFVALSSYRLWMSGLLLFLAANLVIAFLVVIYPEVFA